MMLALDMSDAEQGVTRLDVVKDVIKNSSIKRAHDRLGLVAFSVNPYLVSALTLDKGSPSKLRPPESKD